MVNTVGEESLLLIIGSDVLRNTGVVSGRAKAAADVIDPVT